MFFCQPDNRTHEGECGMTESSRRVLVVDDVAVNRKLAMAFFQRLGWTAAEADGGIPGLEWLKANPSVDLVLLDIRMPDLNGEEVCRQLRAMPEFASLPVVAYTAHAMPGDVDRLLARGFDRVLIKPISLQAIKDVVRDLFPDARPE